MLFVWALIGAISILPAHGAESCDEVRLDDPGGSMEHVSVRSQADFGVCYAETAVEAMDAYRFTHLKIEGAKDYSFQGSGFLAALETAKVLRDLNKYNESLLKEGKMRFVPGDWAARPVGDFKPDYTPYEGFDAGNTETGGYVCKIFKHIQKKGLAQTFEGENTGNYWSGLLKVLRTEWTEAYNQRYQIKWIFGVPSPRENATVAERVDYLDDCLRAVGYQVNRHDVLDGLLSDSREAILTLITETDSKEKRLRLPKDVQCTPFPSNDGPSQLISAIHSHFDQKTRPIQPLAASICSKFLLSGQANYAGVGWMRAENFIRTEKDCEPHALLIIGRRKNPKTGNCQLLLRNSWGLNPGGYATEWEATKGNIWVDESALAKNIYELDVLKEN